MNPEEGHVNFASDPIQFDNHHQSSLFIHVFTFISIKKSYVNAKIGL